MKHGTPTILTGDIRVIAHTLPAEHFHMMVTSPPYWQLRDYNAPGQIGLEASPAEHIAALVQVFNELRPALRKDGTLWVNYGDTYAGSGRGGNPNGPSSTLQGGKENQEASRIKRTTQSRRRDNTEVPRSDSIPVKGLKPKNLIGLPWMLAFALQADGWYLRSDIIWNKTNPMPESAKDRPTRSHEYLFLLSKSRKYHYDWRAIAEPSSERTHSRGKGTNPKAMVKVRDGRKQNQSFAEATAGDVEIANKRTVWSIPTQAYSEAHYATFPEALVRPCILAGCPEGGHVLDPFGGSGTTAAVACQLGRHATIIELNPEYAAQARRRIGLALAPSTYRDDRGERPPLFA